MALGTRKVRYDFWVGTLGLNAVSVISAIPAVIDMIVSSNIGQMAWWPLQQELCVHKHLIKEYFAFSSLHYKQAHLLHRDSYTAWSAQRKEIKTENFQCGSTCDPTMAETLSEQYKFSFLNLAISPQASQLNTGQASAKSSSPFHSPCGGRAMPLRKVAVLFPMPVCHFKAC